MFFQMSMELIAQMLKLHVTILKMPYVTQTMVNVNVNLATRWISTNVKWRILVNFSPLDYLHISINNG
jgi:hypothetical protein